LLNKQKYYNNRSKNFLELNKILYDSWNGILSSQGESTYGQDVDRTVCRCRNSRTIAHSREVQASFKKKKKNNEKEKEKEHRSGSLTLTPSLLPPP
jgi:hypothetical protein